MASLPVVPIAQVLHSTMPQFRWPELKHNMVLAKEVLSKHPNKPACWESIAGALSAVFSTEDKPVDLKGRVAEKG